MKSKALKIITTVAACIALIVSVAYMLYVPETTAEYKENILMVQDVSDGEVELFVNLKNYKKATAYPVLDEEGNLDWYISVKVNLLSKIFPDGNTLNNIITVDSGGWDSLQNGGAVRYSFVYEGVPTARNIYYTETDIEKDEVDREELFENRVLVWSSDDT